MNEEIKEILDSIKEQSEEENWIQLSPEFIQPLLDYITNLQQEIEKLTAESTEWEERTYCWQDRAENLEIIIDKAIEYIENPRHEMSVLTYQNLLNILQNGSEENGND